MTKRILLIGQAPGPKTDPDLPLFPVPATSTGGRLLAMTGLSLGTYLADLERINLLPYFPGRHKRDDKFPMTPAKLAARVIRPLLGGRTVIMIGRNVADAFGLDAPFHEWRWVGVQRRSVSQPDLQGADIAVVPHPSGRNPWYRNEDNARQSETFWAETRNLLASLQA